MQCPYKPSLSRASYLISEACRVRLIRDIFDFTIPGDVVELIWIFFKNTPDFAADNYSTITAPLKLNNFRSLSRQYARKN